MSDAKSIAASLSEAQREALVNGTCRLRPPNEEWAPECICGVYPDSIVQELIALGLAGKRPRFPGGIVRTKLGLQVKALLSGQKALLELAERCEAANGADRELDADIHCATQGFEKRWNEQFEITQYWRDERWIGMGSMPAYTASLDAAMALVPEGHLWAVEAGGHKDGCGGWCYDKEIHNAGPSLATTPALALTAAALRARAAQ